MTQQHSIELNQAMCTIAKAHVKAAKFPGVDIHPRSDGLFDITAIDSAYSRLGVGLDDLDVEVGCAVDELTGRYGEGGARLGDLVLDIRINPALVGE